MVYCLINTEIRYRGEKMDLELTTKEPIYIQIKRHIEMKIISGILKGGQRMPSVREYANELKVKDIIEFYRDFYKDFDNEEMERLLKFMNLNKEMKTNNLSKEMCEKLA